MAETEFYRHPINGHIEKVSADAAGVYFWTGPFWFVAKGMWGQAIACTICAILTFGVSHLVYLFLDRSLFRQHLMRQGYTRVEDMAEDPNRFRPFALTGNNPFDSRPLPTWEVKLRKGLV